MNDLSDRQLLDRFADQGDNAAFAVLMQRHRPDIFRLCKRILGQHADAEDALQSTFVVLARHAGSQQWTQSIGQWLFRVAYYIALKARERQGDQLSVLSEEPEERSSTLDELELGELGTILLEELDCLPSTFRQPLVLCYLRGLSQQEVARRLGIPRRTLQRQLERGRIRLRQQLIRRGITASICRVAFKVEDYVLAWLDHSDNPA
jgi:RNA polymerase sigma-70 factor (ECF subfamily)